MKSSALAAAIAPFLAEHASTDGSPEAAARALVAGDSAATVARVAAFLAALDERLAASESTPIEDLVDLAAVECYWERDAGGRYTRYLPAAYGDWAQRAQALLGRTAAEVTELPTDAPQWRAYCDDVAARRPFRDFEFESRLEGLEPRWLAVSGRPRFAADGSFLGYRGVVRDITARKRSEAQLYATMLEAQTLALIAASTSNGVMLTDDQGRIVWVNAGFTRMIGYTLPEVRGRTPTEVITGPGSDRAATERIIAARARGESVRTEQRAYTRDGRELWLEAVVEPIRDSTGRIVRWMTINHDITARRIAGDALRESEARFRSLTELSSDHYWEQDEHYRYTRLQGDLDAAMREKRLQLLGRTTWEFLGADPAAEPWSSHIALRQERLPFRDFEFRGVGLNGEPRWLSSSGMPVFDAAGRFRGYRGVTRNITGRKLAEERLRSMMLEAQTLATVAAHTSNGVLITDAQNRIEWVNRGFTRITGRELKDVAGCTPHDVLTGPDSDQAVSTIIREARERGAAVRVEQCAYAANGRKFWVEVELQPIRDAAGRVQRWISVMNDVTARRRMLAELSEAKEAAEAANVAKSGFLANMSHEIRTPMNGILGMTELALATELTHEQREYLVTVHESAEALISIINDVLDFSKIEAGRLSVERIEFNLRKLVIEALKMIAVKAHEKELDLAFEIAPEVPDRLVSDPTRLRQILINLLGNAIKFTAAGSVHVAVRALERREGEIRLELGVHDTGIGIAADKRATIFDAFSQADSSITRRFGGTGLGLSICTRLAELLGGRITVTSEPGMGSVFRFDIVAGVGVAEERTPDVRALADRRVLYVSAQPVTSWIVAAQLERLGARVGRADAQSAALTQAGEAAAAGAPFEIAVLDGDLADDGAVQTAQLLRARFGMPAVMLVRMTAYVGVTKRCRDLRLGRAVMKPADPVDLARALVEELSAGAPQAPATALAGGAGAPCDRLELLLVEDNVVNQKLALRLLARAGHKVTLAEDGAQALALFKQRRFDCVLMDLQMPVMDGLDATRAIRAHEAQTDAPADGGTPAKRTPIVAMTANAMGGDRERCIGVGMDDYVAKPIRAQELFAALERATGVVSAAAAA